MKNHSSSEISIPMGKIKLDGELVIPEGSGSLVLFSHGSGSSRLSSRNNFVARELQKHTISTFLFDLLTKEEDEHYLNRFNIDLLAERLIFVTNYIVSLSVCKSMKIGFFGASTGAASALKAAVALPAIIKAIVSRGGRVDLVMDMVPLVKPPTMLIIGEKDYDVLDLNREVYESLKCEKRLEIIPGATHLFEEAGALQKVALSAGDWFGKYLQNAKSKMTTV